MSDTPSVDNSYIPRKCSYSNQILTSKDHSSIQINLSLLNKNGIYSGKQRTYAISGMIRKKGDSDKAINLMAEKHDFN